MNSYFSKRMFPYYATHRDYTEIPGGKLILYRDWNEVLPLAQKHLADADVGMVTSYCPDGIAGHRICFWSRAAH